MSAAVIKLSEPIQAHGEEVSELTLREPTTEDVIKFGQPFLVIPRDGGDTGVEIRMNIIARYVSELAAIPMSSVKKLSRNDFSACQAAVMGFFGGGDGEETPKN